MGELAAYRAANRFTVIFGDMLCKAELQRLRSRLGRLVRAVVCTINNHEEVSFDIFLNPAPRAKSRGVTQLVGDVLITAGDDYDSVTHAVVGRLGNSPMLDAALTVYQLWEAESFNPAEMTEITAKEWRGLLKGEVPERLKSSPLPKGLYAKN